MSQVLLLSAAPTEQEMMRAMSLGSKLGGSLLVMVVGLVVVFLGLIILIGACKVIGLVFSAQKKKPETAKPVSAPVAPAAPAVTETPALVPSEDEDELAAVFAAIAAVMSTPQNAAAAPGGFTVRRIRRTGSANNWGTAGREELLSSKYL